MCISKTEIEKNSNLQAERKLWNMLCIFCKQESARSKSVEHIIPESLGNTKNVLPKGVVCDRCNDYFGRKVEQPVLSLPFFKQLRARNSIESKKKKIPLEELLVYHPEVSDDDHKGLLLRRSKGIPMLHLPWGIAKKMMSTRSSKILVQSLYINNPPKEDVLVARLLAKIGYEMLANIALHNKWSLDVVIEDERLYPLRNFARFASTGDRWQYYTRKLYKENEKFFYTSDLNSAVDVLYQYDLFFVDDEMFFTVVLKGYEFTINMGRPNIETYVKWLLLNKGESVIYKRPNLFNDNIPTYPQMLRLY